MRRKTSVIRHYDRDSPGGGYNLDRSTPQRKVNFRGDFRGYSAQDFGFYAQPRRHRDVLQDSTLVDICAAQSSLLANIKVDRL